MQMMWSAPQVQPLRWMEAILKLLHHQRLNPSMLATNHTLKLKTSAWTWLTSLPPANVTLGVQQPTVSGRKKVHKSVSLGTQNPHHLLHVERRPQPHHCKKRLPTKQLQPRAAVWMEDNCGYAVCGVTKKGHQLCCHICHHV